MTCLSGSNVFKGILQGRISPRDECWLMGNAKWVIMHTKENIWVGNAGHNGLKTVLMYPE